MLIDVLNERSKALREEFNKARQNVVNLSEQLEQGKASLNVISGHLNEAAYLLAEAQKLSPVTMDSAEQGDPIHVETNIEAEEQVAQE